MGDNYRGTMDLLNQATQVVGQGLQAWGVTQSARRASQYQTALTQTREQYNRLMDELERNPDYASNSRLFEEASQRILQDVSELYLNDPYVKQQYDLQYGNIKESARDVAAQITQRREQVALVTEGYKNLEATHELGFEQGQIEAAAIINGLKETGIIFEDGEEEMWNQWRRQGAMLVEERLKSAVENNDREMVDRVLNGAYATEIIRDPETVGNRRRDAYHAIFLQETETELIEMGYEQAIPAILNPENYTELSGQERMALFSTMGQLQSYAEERERYRINQIDLGLQNQAEEWETKFREGDIPVSDALAWLRTDQIRGGLKPDTYRMLETRWSAMEAVDDNGSDGLSAEQKAANYARTYMWLTTTRPEGLDAMERIYGEIVAGLYGRGEFDALMAMVNEPESEGLAVYGWIGEELAIHAEDLGPAETNRLTLELGQQAAQFMYKPNGERRTQGEVLDLVKTAVANSVEPIVLKRQRDTSIQIGEWLLGFNVLDDSERNLTTVQDQRALFGILMDSPMMAALNAEAAAAGTLYTDENEDTLIDLFVRSKYGNNRNFDSLTEREQNVIRTNARATLLNASHLRTFSDITGNTNPEMALTEDGSIMFVGPQNRWVQARVDPDTKDERWFEMEVDDAGEESWVPIDYMVKEEAPAPADDGDGGGGIVRDTLDDVRTGIEASRSAYTERMTGVFDQLDRSRLDPGQQTLFDQYLAKIENGDQLSGREHQILGRWMASQGVGGN
jgi:hypothetical protein